MRIAVHSGKTVVVGLLITALTALAASPVRADEDVAEAVVNAAVYTSNIIRSAKVGPSVDSSREKFCDQFVKLYEEGQALVDAVQSAGLQGTRVDGLAHSNLGALDQGRQKLCS